MNIYNWYHGIIGWHPVGMYSTVESNMQHTVQFQLLPILYAVQLPILPTVMDYCITA